MGWRLRRSWSVGPVRLNLSRSGVGWSWAVPGLRYGRTATGLSYVCIGFPGLGLYWMKYRGTERAALGEGGDEIAIATRDSQQLPS
jgi:hypothetical protein